ncbi:MAG: ArsR/SmtB family transcription factor [Gulosibacter sp.]|uniref:ArsR/SmtB family transcription factor n=1 Tax=Gulosibacter sp. TaxID=2817531 RepID=UPI003F90C11E
MPIATDPLSRIFFALADPTRRAVLDQLSTGPASVNDIAKPFAMSRPAISQHLRVLEEAGLIERTRTGQFRPCVLRPEGLTDAEQWIEQHRSRWQSRFDQLDDVLRELNDRAPKSPGDANTPVGSKMPDTDVGTNEEES